MYVQKTEWGNINWLHMPDKNLSGTINVGITTIEINRELSYHVHYGVEQFIYILEGNGYYEIDGIIKYFKAGDYFYIQADASHQTVNTGDTIVRELLIANSVQYDSSIQVSNFCNNQNDRLIYEAVESIRTQLLSKLNLPFTIFDSEQNIVIQNDKFQLYCQQQCSPSTDYATCPCLQVSTDVNIEKKDYYCPYGLTVFIVPIFYQGSILGYIRGGHILLSDSGKTNSNEILFDTPKSTADSIKNLLKQIVKSIVSFCEYNMARQELLNKDKTIQESKQNKELLEKDLIIAQNSVTNLKINHHFLFNTLNSMAEMALSGSSDNLYNSIIDLGKIFRYTMSSELRYVSLEYELEYLKNYLNLQKLRYSDALDVEYDIQNDLLSIKIPFNFLQPIVENAFTHGFFEANVKKLIKIKVKQKNGKVYISVINNGLGLDKITLNRIEKSIQSNTGHGLSLIYQKLKMSYNLDFTFDISSTEDGETSVIIIIPRNV